MIRGIFLMCLLLPILGTSAQGAPARIALVIGNSDYEHAPLKNPLNDAALMTATLRDVGFEVFDYANVNRRELKRAFSSFGKRVSEAGRDTISLVYYSGHGAQVRGENYLIPISSIIEDELDVDIEGIRASSLMGTLEEAKPALSIVILDACRNNPFKSSSRSANRGLAKTDAPTGTLLAYSTAPGQLAEDGSGSNSAYTKALSLAIRSPGAKVEEVFKRVRIEVMTRTLDEQVPWESSSLIGDFYFVEEATSVKPTTQIAPAPAIVPIVEIEYWKSIANSNDVALYQVYLDRYPEGLFQGIAEQRVASMNAASNAKPANNGEKITPAIVPIVEIEYWKSIATNNDVALYQVYLDRYPRGLFQGIAEQRIASLKAAEHAKTANNGTWTGAGIAKGACEVNRFKLKLKVDGRKVTGMADIQSYGFWPLTGSIDLEGKLKARLKVDDTTVYFSGTAKDAVLTGKWDATEVGCAGPFTATLMKR